MTEINTGDTVVCINADDSFGTFHYGGDYRVFAAKEPFTTRQVMIEGVDGWWDASRFRKPIVELVETSTIIRHVGLGFVRTGDSRSMHMRLMIQDADWEVEAIVDLDEHQFAQLLSGQNITVECEL